MSRPGGFQPLSYLSLNQQLFIMSNVPEVQEKEQFTYVAMAVVAGIIPEEDVYTNGLLEQGQMQATIDEGGRSAFPNISWYQKTFVFIEQGSSFQTYTPMIESNLTMMSDGESNVVFQNPESGGNVITSTFQKDGDSYQWKTSMDNTFLSFDTDTGNMKFGTNASLFKFTEPPIFWSLAGVPRELRQFAKLSEDRRELIKMNIDFSKESLKTISAARINVRNNEDGDQRLYVELQLEKANLKATTPNTGVDFKEVSWYQYYFVFAKKDEVSFEVFTPVAKQNLILATVGKTQSFSPSPPKGGQYIFQFIAADNDYWYWKVKGEDLYLYCDPVTGDITATDDLSKRSQFRFLYDEEEDQSDGKPPEQEVCKQEAGEQEAGEQEAGRQRKMCKVQ